MLQVVVHGDDDLERRLPDAGDQRVVLPVVPGQADRPDGVDPAGQLGGGLPRVVRASVDDEDHLVPDGQTVKDRHESVHQRRKGPR